MAAVAMEPKVFSLEGNIGSGKTTLLGLLEDFTDQDQLKILLQPVSQWQEVGQNKTNVLDLFYKNAEEWAFPFQILTLFSRLDNLTKGVDKDTHVVVTERSLEGDYNIFAKEMENSGLFGQSQMDVYFHMYEAYCSMFRQYNSKGVIYLRTDPQVCHERILKRKRPEESAVPLSYLEDLHSLHQKWLNSLDKPVLIIDGNTNFQTDSEVRAEVARKIAKFLGLDI